MERRLVQRADKVAFLNVDETYHRMQGFTGLSNSRNPKEYTRQYVDEFFETTDVVGISASMDFAFDQYLGDKVHEKLAQLIDDEIVGTDAVVEIMVVDFTSEIGSAGNTYQARKRKYSVIPNTDGGSLDAYTYEGTFKVNGSTEKVKATSTDDWLTATITEE